MSEKRFESRYNSRDGEYWLFDNKYDSCLLILNSDIQLHNLIILLNQMNEENEKLQKENIELKKLRKYCAEWIGVKEENLYDVVR